MRLSVIWTANINIMVEKTQDIHVAKMRASTLLRASELSNLLLIFPHEVYVLLTVKLSQIPALLFFHVKAGTVCR